MPRDLEIPEHIDLVEFISKEAHDLKSPFNRALGFLKLVIKGMDGPIPDLARDDLNIAYQNSQLALVLMSGVIEAARLSQAERQLLPAEFSLVHLLQGVVKEWKKFSPKEKLAEVSYQVPEAAIWADEMLLRRGLVNWIAYVGEFAPEDTRIEIGVGETPPAFTFTIQSTGKKGLPPPECDLTLYGFIARKIIELHGGALEGVEETEDGARVSFRLPR